MFLRRNRFLAYAPIDKKVVTLKLQDGFANLNDSPVTSGAEIVGATLITISPGTMSRTVPVGSHFTVAGDLTLTKHRVTSRTFDAVGADEVQQTATSTATAGTFTMSFTKPAGNPGTVTTQAIDWDATAAEGQTIIDTAWAGEFVDGVLYTAGDIALTGTSFDTTAMVVTYSGASAAKKNWPQFTIEGAGLTAPDTEGAITTTTPGEAAGSTDTVTFTPGLATATSGGEALTFTGIELVVDLGEGSNITYDESRTIELFRARGLLGSGNGGEWRLGDEEPIELEFSFTWKFIKSIGGATPGVEEALEGIDNASTWTSASTFECAGYSVNVVFENEPNCSGAGELDEEIIFPEFIYAGRGHDPETGLITITGQCNASKAIITRKDLSLSSP